MQVSVDPYTVRYRQRSSVRRRQSFRPALGRQMQQSLKGRSILLVEDEFLIAMNVAYELETAGASVIITEDLKEALLLAELPGLAGAILDHGLGGGDSSQLRSRLSAHQIPFLNYSARPSAEDGTDGSVHLTKPAAEGALSAAMLAAIDARAPDGRLD